MTFPYVRAKSGGYYPLVPVTLKYRLRQAKAEALVDSGATVSIFNLVLAEALGVSLTQADAVTLEGVGGTVEGYYKTIRLDIGTIHLRAPVIFTGSFTSVNLLGRKGVFDQAHVCFSDADRTLRIGS